MKSFILSVVCLFCACGSLSASDTGCVNGKCSKVVSTVVASSLGAVKQTVAVASGLVVEQVENVSTATRTVVKAPARVVSAGVSRTKTLLVGGVRKVFRGSRCR